MLRRREMMHIYADLRDQMASGHPVHAGDGLPEGDGRFEWADLLVNLCFDALNPSLDLAHVVEVGVEPAAVGGSQVLLQALHVAGNPIENTRVDLLARRPEDTARRYEEGDPLIREALDRGKVLYERHR